MKREISATDRRVNHDDVMNLILCLPGKDMIRSVLRSIMGNAGPDFVYYASRCEFRLGPCGCNRDPSRIDSIVEVRVRLPAHASDSDSALRIGFEIKTTMDDLIQSDNLCGKYIHSGQCDYYFILAPTGDLALKACRRYSDEPLVGVVCLDTGKVLKIPERVATTVKGNRHYVQELVRRSLSDEKDSYHEHHLKDEEWINLDLRC